MIRIYEAGDLAEIQGWWASGIDTYDLPTPEWSEYVLNHPNVACFCEVSEGVVRGIAQYDIHDGVAYVGIVVSPWHRRQGVASLLLRTVERGAAAQNVHRLAASVDPHNAPARALVEHHGLTYVGVEEDLLLFEKAI